MTEEALHNESTGTRRNRRVFYANGGPANIIAAHQAWKAGVHEPTEVSITFSSQVADFCEGIGADAYFVTPYGTPRIEQIDGYTLEQRPKKGGGGLAYHLNEFLYGIGLFRTARRFKADIAFMDTGSAPIFTLFLFRLFGIPVVPILHNTLWPAHFEPTQFQHKALRWLDRLFWRHGASGAIGVSPECELQIRTEAPRLTYPVVQIRAQFHRDYFTAIPPPPPHSHRPFRVMFIGRVTHSKGVFDILEMARSIEKTDPGLVRWTICGRGDALEALTQQREAMGLQGVVDLAGWVSLEQLIDIYTQSHAAIVPTRSSFTEALAMTAAEAVLAGRPVILNPVVPAIDLLGPACLAGKTDDAESHAGQVRLMARDPILYEKLREACPSCWAPFYDRDQGLAAGMREITDRLGLSSRGAT
jgi:glycosyltransferase involved in cell wall biosynthesis